MTERVVFLDIDGPIIPYSMFLIDKMASWHRIIPPVTVAVVREVCKRSGAKVVFNTTHNTPASTMDGVPEIEDAVRDAGLPAEMIHVDLKTRYPQIERREAVHEWLSRHPEVTDWIAFDDAKFTDADNLIWVDPDGGLHLGHLNQAMDRWGCGQFIVL